MIHHWITFLVLILVASDSYSLSECISFYTSTEVKQNSNLKSSLTYFKENIPVSECKSGFEIESEGVSNLNKLQKDFELIESYTTKTENIKVAGVGLYHDKKSYDEIINKLLPLLISQANASKVFFEDKKKTLDLNQESKVINKDLESINTLCRELLKKRNELVQVIDPEELYKTQLPKGRNFNSDNPVAQMKRRIDTGILQFDELYEDSVNQAINSLFSKDEFQLLLASKRFRHMIGLDHLENKFQAKSLAQKCFTKGYIFAEYSENIFNDSTPLKKSGLVSSELLRTSLSEINESLLSKKFKTLTRQENLKSLSGKDRLLLQKQILQEEIETNPELITKLLSLIKMEDQKLLCNELAAVFSKEKIEEINHRSKLLGLTGLTVLSLFATAGLSAPISMSIMALGASLDTIELGSHAYKKQSRLDFKIGAPAQTRRTNVDDINSANLIQASINQTKLEIMGNIGAEVIFTPTIPFKSAKPNLKVLKASPEDDVLFFSKKPLPETIEYNGKLFDPEKLWNTSAGIPYIKKSEDLINQFKIYHQEISSLENSLIKSGFNVKKVKRTIPLDKTKHEYFVLEIIPQADSSLDKLLRRYFKNLTPPSLIIDPIILKGNMSSAGFSPKFNHMYLGHADIANIQDGKVGIGFMHELRHAKLNQVNNPFSVRIRALRNKSLHYLYEKFYTSEESFTYSKDLIRIINSEESLTNALEKLFLNINITEEFNRVGILNYQRMHLLLKDKINSPLDFNKELLLLKENKLMRLKDNDLNYVFEVSATKSELEKIDDLIKKGSSDEKREYVLKFLNNALEKSENLNLHNNHMFEKTISLQTKIDKFQDIVDDTANKSLRGLSPLDKVKSIQVDLAKDIKNLNEDLEDLAKVFTLSRDNLNDIQIRYKINEYDEYEASIINSKIKEEFFLDDEILHSSLTDLEKKTALKASNLNDEKGTFLNFYNYYLQKQIDAKAETIRHMDQFIENPDLINEVYIRDVIKNDIVNIQKAQNEIFKLLPAN